MSFSAELTVDFRLFIPLDTADLISDMAFVTVVLMFDQLVLVLLLIAVHVLATVFLMTPIAVLTLFFIVVSAEVMVLPMLLHLLVVLLAEKSWGSFKVVDVESESLTIKVTLNAGHSMNYHSHKNRDEVWVVISGSGKTIVDGFEQAVKAGDVITMSAGCRHTVMAETELKLIEVQLGMDINVHDKQKFALEY